MIFDGKKSSQTKLDLLKQEVPNLTPTPHLAIINVGDNTASKIYVNKKVEAGEYIGCEVEVLRFSEDAQETEIIRQIRTLNEDKLVTGILIQLPLPKFFDTKKVLSQISPKKDVDGLGVGALSKSATALAVLEILKESKIPISGQHAVVVGASDLVGKPTAGLLLDEGATVTVCHDKTKDLASITRLADILVSAVGKPRLITADMIKSGVAIVDVGISKENDRIVGDVDFEAVSPATSLITPVPGGVGPMTVAMLFSNLIDASKK